ncbi:hypothetical protein BDP81DRAFT_119867 [Colletotrichum phormii]|uniref:Uncharacterized protein n=1 Tax=Colletotrichum phormii TaxID=359342 RepID=A0AAI9ZG68_9PEZI|nr:uncharacterized protein BDP81DRAFT_119867 [Colletotrichum phormii]KAK1623623.1 hypothetical protein BDP81DRAFT_119867 [Colletotrichum phormii]
MRCGAVRELQCGVGVEGAFRRLRPFFSSSLELHFFGGRAAGRDAKTMQDADAVCVWVFLFGSERTGLLVLGSDRERKIRVYSSSTGQAMTEKRVQCLWGYLVPAQGRGKKKRQAVSPKRLALVLISSSASSSSSSCSFFCFVLVRLLLLRLPDTNDAQRRGKSCNRCRKSKQRER